MANRKQPFGYKMEQGQIVAHLREAEVVRMIFAQYNSGASMGALAQMLNKQDIPYEDGKLWNKNMAARILADKRYLGAGGYPVIMDDDSFQKAREKREKKQCPVQKTAAQKVLRRLSGQAVSAQVERRVMEKEKRGFMEQQRKENSEMARRIDSASAAMERITAALTQWDEMLIRQIVDTVRVASAEEIVVTLKNGEEIGQSLM